MVFPEIRTFLIDSSIYGELAVFSKTLTSHSLQLSVRSLSLEELINSNKFPKSRCLCTKCCGGSRVKWRCTQRREYAHGSERLGQVFFGLLFIVTSWSKELEEQHVPTQMWSSSQVLGKTYCVGAMK